METSLTVARIFWDALQWILTAEEMLAYTLAHHNVPHFQRVIYLSLANMSYIGLDFAIVVYFAHLQWVKVLIQKTDQVIKKLSRGRKITLFDLFLLDFTPLMQKFGVVAYYAKRKKFGIRGLIALCAGGLCRVFVYAYLGHYLPILIAVLFTARVVSWVRQNGWVNNQS